MSVVSQSSDHLLRRTLYGNAAFSVVSGAALALFAGSLARASVAAPATLLGLELGTVILLLGIGVVGFGAICWFIASRPTMPVALARIVLWADIGWVAGSALLLALAAPALTFWGFALIIGLAIVVADLAIFEWIGLRRMAV
ncbi:MAG: hypothetical protein KF889_29810 [Alphaproteobacteria bacterium]|nr:hypothetical protein [Alphaproteobacteria bacterium]MCW5743354.1 hypothetical protein [Alphaproteobacteria bacterium]